MTADSKGRLQKARGKAAAATLAACAVTPDFGYAGSETIGLAAAGESLALLNDLFSASLNSVLIDTTVDRAGASCQAAVAKAQKNQAAVRVSVFSSCKRSGLRGGTIYSSESLMTCFDSILSDPRGAVAKATTKLSDAVATRCSGVDLATAFPGTCAAAGDFASCSEAAANCRGCRMINTMDGLSNDCDAFDDGLSNGSCPP